MNEINKNLTEDLMRLRDELTAKAFDYNGYTINSTLAAIVWKINSCLFKGYPRNN